MLLGWVKQTLVHQLNAGAAISNLSDAVVEQESKRRALKSHATLQLSFSILNLLVLSVQEHVPSLHPVNMSQCHDLLWVCCLLREMEVFFQMSYVQGISAAVIYLYGN